MGEKIGPEGTGKSGRGEVWILPDALHLARRGADMFARAAQQSIALKGNFAVALSGGSTPRGMHRLLAQEPFVSGIPWDRTQLFWVDERLVPARDAASNYGAAEKDFLEHVPIPSGHIHPMPVETPPDEGARMYRRELKKSFKTKEGEPPLFDLICLGIGKDGHTGSLFPGQSSLDEREKWVLPVKGGTPYADRLTMTYPVLNNGKRILFLASGSEKAGIVGRVLQGRLSGLPAQRVRPVGGTVVWLLDKEAASLLEKGKQVHDT